MTNQHLYTREPLEVVEGIPVFSKKNFYTENYEEISGDHLSHHQETGENPFFPEYYWRELENSTLALFRQHTSAPGKVLDVGVGMGRMISHLPDWERYGVDISMGYLREAAAKGVEVCYSLVEELPYQENFFDAILCTDVLEHVLDMNRAVEKILSVLKPGGVLVVRVPNHEDMSAYVAPDFPYEYVHLRRLDEYQLQLFFEKIFSCKMLAAQTAGLSFKTGRLVHPGTRKTIWYRAAWKLHPYLNRWIPWVYGWLTKRYYYPAEVNVVVQKPL